MAKYDGGSGGATWVSPSRAVPGRSSEFGGRGWRDSAEFPPPLEKTFEETPMLNVRGLRFAIGDDTNLIPRRRSAGTSLRSSPNLISVALVTKPPGRNANLSCKRNRNQYANLVASTISTVSGIDLTFGLSDLYGNNAPRRRQAARLFATFRAHVFNTQRSGLPEFSCKLQAKSVWHTN